MTTTLASLLVLFLTIATPSTLQVLFPAWLSKQAVSYVKNLLVKDPAKRLGTGPTGEADMKKHPFFSGIDWDKIDTRGVEPPFKPAKGKSVAANFDADFTSEAPVLTPTAKDRVQGIDQDEFAGFSFVAPK